MREEWRDILNFNGNYQVSNIGRVRSIDRVITDKNGIKYFRKGRVLKSVPNQDGYPIVYPSYNGKKYSMKVHRLVAMNFIENKNNLPQVNHINCIKSDNRVENLEWCTAQENIIHSHKSGTACVKRGEEHSTSKLKRHEVIFIIDSYPSQFSSKEIAELFNIDITMAPIIRRGKNWKHMDKFRVENGIPVNP